jgi:hypothetical protein
MSSLTSRKAGAASRKINHRKQQDDRGEQGDVIWHHPSTLSSPAGQRFLAANNIRLDPTGTIGLWSELLGDSALNSARR